MMFCEMARVTGFVDQRGVMFGNEPCWSEATTVSFGHHLPIHRTATCIDPDKGTE
jgi:hypothetical protein